MMFDNQNNYMFNINAEGIFVNGNFMLISHTIKEKTWRENGYYDYIGRRTRRG